MLVPSPVGSKGKRSRLLSLGLIFLMLEVLAIGGFQPAQAEADQAANLQGKDTGNVLPVSLFKGRVTNQASRYILGPGDEVAIKIKDLDQFNQSFTIRPDGYCTVHPLGELYLAGIDVQGLQAWLEESFKTYLVKPEISVDVKEMRPALIYVSGAVKKPGTYQFSRQKSGSASANVAPIQEKIEMTLTNVLGKAGGFNLNADLAHINIVHGSTGQKEEFNFLEFLTSNGAVKDVWLLPEDTITVPEASQPMDPSTFKLIGSSTYFRDQLPVMVLGSVQQQGEIQLDPTNNSVNAAIAKAGGFIPNLSKRDIVIIQRPNQTGGFSRWVVHRDKANLALLPGDIVYVPDSKAAHIERGFKFLSSLTLPVFYGLNSTNILKNQIIPTP